ncbi:hypothetical protein ACA910_022099 [Epithemia clementina (nom. ined.)]
MTTSSRRVFGGKASKLFRFTKMKMFLTSTGTGQRGSERGKASLLKETSIQSMKSQNDQNLVTLPNSQDCEKPGGQPIQKQQRRPTQGTTSSPDPTLSPSSASSSSCLQNQEETQEERLNLNDHGTDDDDNLSTPSNSNNSHRLCDDEDKDDDKSLTSSASTPSEDQLLSCTNDANKGEITVSAKDKEGDSQECFVGNGEGQEQHSRKRKFGMHRENHQYRQSKAAVVTVWPVKNNATAQFFPDRTPVTESTKVKRGRLSKCFSTPRNLDIGNEGNNGNDRKKNKKQKKCRVGSPKQMTKTAKKRGVENRQLSQLDFPNNDEQSAIENESSGGGKFVGLGSTSTDLQQPTSQTCLLKAKEFFDRLDHETLAVEHVQRATTTTTATSENGQPCEDLIGGLSSSSPAVPNNRLYQYRTRRVLSLREPGVASIYQMHLQVCREAGVTPMSLEAFWEEQRKQRQNGESNKDKTFYDGFLDEN